MPIKISLAVLLVAAGAVVAVLLYRGEVAVPPPGPVAPGDVTARPPQPAPSMTAEPEPEPAPEPESEPEPDPGGRQPVAERAGGPGVPDSDQERVRRRAAAFAEQLGLSQDEALALREVLLQEQSRRAASFRSMRGAADQAAARVRVRGELDAILAWKTETLRTRFGAERAALMMRR